MEYYKNKIFKYKDLDTGVILDVSLDARMDLDSKWIQFEPLKLCFFICDFRKQTGSQQIFMNLNNLNVSKLMHELKSVNVNTIFEHGHNINIVQYYSKMKKDLSLVFGYRNNDQVCQLSITDSATQIKSIITLDKIALITLVNIIKDYSSNYINYDINLKQLFLTYKLLKTPQTIVEKQITENAEIPKTIIESDNIDVSEFDDTVIEPSVEQQDFLDVARDNDDFKNVDLQIPKQNIYPAKINNEDKLFISAFLNYDLLKLAHWTTSFVCLTEKSNSNSFLPFNIIMDLGRISAEERQKYSNDYGYYDVQYLLLKQLKNAVKQSLATGTYPKNTPPIRFGTNIKQGTELYNLSKEILVVFLIFSFIINNFANIQNVDPIKLDNIRRSYFIVKLLFVPFLFSLELNDTIIDELTSIFNLCIDGGLFKTLKEDYLQVTCGGNLNITTEMFNAYCKSFIGVLQRNEVDKFDTLEKTQEIFNKCKVDYHGMQLLNGTDIKNLLFNIKVEQEVKENQPRTKPIINDTVKLYVKCCEDFINKDIQKTLLTANSISQVKKLLIKYDVPAEIFRIMRIMELYPNLNKKDDILKSAKLIKEDVSVSKSKCLEEDTSDIDPSFDVQDLLSENY